MELWEQLSVPEVWQEFLQYKLEKQHLSHAEQKELETYIEEKRYLDVLSEISEEGRDFPLPMRREINKVGASKKRVVYSFQLKYNILLKLMAFLLHRYDGQFADNCYAFRRDYGVRDAVRKILRTKDIWKKYCLKVDISNYFNSIPVEQLLEKLDFLKAKDAKIHDFLCRLITVNQAVVSEDGQEHIVTEERGAMAGMPLSPFLANVYLSDVDAFFEAKGVLYFRYSDDILLFADSEEQLEEYRELLYEKLREKGLSLNLKKVQITKPGETFTFLGFGFRDGQVDLAGVTVEKIKGKIKRKSHSLRKWQKKKDLSADKAAKGFIHAMNRKFYGSGEDAEFSWSRWFFPCLTCDEGLREVDAYMQQYIRFCVTGRHYKGNYRISYEQMKEWGYRSLVHEYYASKES